MFLLEKQGKASGLLPGFSVQGYLTKNRAI
jgi:hypothetical protein